MEIPQKPFILTEEKSVRAQWSRCGLVINIPFNSWQEPVVKSYPGVAVLMWCAECYLACTLDTGMIPILRALRLYLLMLCSSLPFWFHRNCEGWLSESIWSIRWALLFLVYGVTYSGRIWTERFGRRNRVSKCFSSQPLSYSRQSYRNWVDSTVPWTAMALTLVLLLSRCYL